jgi:predicted O-methyltransferase YrrM
MVAMSQLPSSASVRSGIEAVDGYLDSGYTTVPGMSSRFAAAVCGGLMRIQGELGVTGPVAEIGPFEGRFFIALAHALVPGEAALGIDLFDWPDPQVIDRFEANCARHGVAPERRITWKADSRTMRPEELLAKLGGRRPRLIHIDGEHSRTALTQDLELATAVLAPAGVIVLDDMLHPGYPTLMVAVHEYLRRHRMRAHHHRPRDRSGRDQVRAVPHGRFKRYERLLVDYRTTSGRSAPTSSRTGAWCCRSTRGSRRLSDRTRHPGS